MEPNAPHNQSKSHATKTRRRRLMLFAAITFALIVIAFVLPDAFWNIVIPNVNTFNID